MKKMFCWQCGKALNYRRGVPVFVTVQVGGNPVKVHLICKQGAIDSQKFDTTPRPGNYQSDKPGGMFHDFTRETPPQPSKVDD